MHWKEAQAGHYIKRQHSATFLDVRNVYPQCPRCNLFLGGNMDSMALHIIKVHGLETLEDLGRLKHTAKKFTRGELMEFIERHERYLEKL